MCVVLASCAPDVRIASRPISGSLAAERHEYRSGSREVLRREGLSRQYRQDPYAALQTLNERYQSAGGEDRLFALAELCGSLGASLKEKSPDAAAGCYLDAARLGWAAAVKMPTSGQDRELLLIYNEACASLSNLLKKQKQDWSEVARFRGPLGTHRLSLGRPSDGRIDWDDFSELIPADRLELRHAKLERKVQAGLGGAIVAHMPYRAVTGSRKNFEEDAGLVLPVNVMLDFSSSGDRAELVLRNALQVDHVRVGGRRVPLEVDWSASLAYLYRYAPPPDVGFKGMLRPAEYDSKMHLIELEPFDEDKIPVVLVHGLMSSPETWIDMVNNLRADPVLRQHYQLVMFRYPTGYSIARNAASLRASLEDYRAVYENPQSRRNMNQMVLIGHSMGGILSSWQIRDSGDAIRKMVLDRPLDEVQVDPEVREMIGEIITFDANPNVTRAIFMAAPHRGSKVASSWIGGLGSKLIRLPNTLRMGLSRSLLTEIPGFSTQARRYLQARPDSVYALRPDNPYLGAMIARPVVDRVTYHTIAGQVNWRKPVTEGTDTLVPYWSSHLDGAASEKIVDAKHTEVTHHPDSINEVRRLLHLHIGRTPDFQKRLGEDRPMKAGASDGTRSLLGRP